MPLDASATVALPLAEYGLPGATVTELHGGAINRFWAPQVALLG